MTRLLVTFERIGRNHAVPPLEADVDGPLHLADLVLGYARPHLMSSEVEVHVDLTARTGHITVGGFRNAGAFKIAEGAE